MLPGPVEPSSAPFPEWYRVKRERGAIMDASSTAYAKQRRTAKRLVGHVVFAPIALIMIVLGGIVFSLVVIYSKLMRL